MMCERPSSVSQERFNSPIESSISPSFAVAAAVIAAVVALVVCRCPNVPLFVRLLQSQQQHPSVHFYIYDSERAFQSPNFPFFFFLFCVSQPLMDINRPLDFFPHFFTLPLPNVPLLFTLMDSAQ